MRREYQEVIRVNENIKEHVLEDETLKQVSGGSIKGDVVRILGDIGDKIEDKIRQTIDQTIKHQGMF